MSDKKNKRRFRQLQKHEAGYALIAIALVLFVMAWMIGEYRFTIIAVILAGTGVIFQFGKGPPDNPYYGESGHK
ncbi:MAG: hypothetical protein LAT55_08920 [Opitutales bacterium]|nr:hypothetical protein [Opitutales bacterium]